MKPSATRSTFAVAFIAAPNMIDFSTVWAKFAGLKDNAAVFSVIVVCVGLYLIGLVFAVREDRKDHRRVGHYSILFCINIKSSILTKVTISQTVFPHLCYLYATVSSIITRSIVSQVCSTRHLGLSQSGGLTRCLCSATHAYNNHSHLL